MYRPALSPKLFKSNLDIRLYAGDEYYRRGAGADEGQLTVRAMYRLCAEIVRYCRPN